MATHAPSLALGEARRPADDSAGMAAACCRPVEGAIQRSTARGPEAIQSRWGEIDLGRGAGTRPSRARARLLLASRLVLRGLVEFFSMVLLGALALPAVANSCPSFPAAVEARADVMSGVLLVGLDWLLVQRAHRQSHSSERSALASGRRPTEG